MDEERHDQPMESRYEPGTGYRGGAASFAAPAPTEDFLMAWAKTVVRWSPIWVGFLVALGINLVLYILTLAVTLSATNPVAGAARNVLQTAGIWSAISTIIALFVGGFLSGRLGVQQGLRSGIMQGTVVWALFVIFAMLLSLFGLGGFVSGLSGLANVRAMTAGGAGVSPVETQRIIGSAANGLWWLFGGLVVAWLASVIGGYLGVLSARPEETTQHS